MFIYVLQIREYLSGDAQQLYLFSLAATAVWLSWAVKTVLSRRYRPWVAPYAVGTTVLIPVVDEPLELFREVLRRIEQQRPTETIVVVNGAANPLLEAVCAEFPSVTCTWTPVAGKRNAIRVGLAMTTQPIVVLVDSDTLWTEYRDAAGLHRTLDELVKPFADPRVGGVTTRQRILAPERSWITRWADWLENTRALYSMPAMSVLGQVGCLPGRTIALRRESLERSMPGFMSERFLGVFLEISDDRTLTNYALKQGYRTVYQSTSLVYTDAPLEVRKLFKQQLRWARGSQYNTLRMLGWMLAHTPVLAFFFLLDIIVPFLLVGALLGWIYREFTQTGSNFYQPLLDAFPGWVGFAVIAGLVVASSWTSMLVRQSRHLAECPWDILRMPVYVLASTLFMMPVRLLGFVRMAHSASWGTREGAHSGKHVEPAATPSLPCVPTQLSRTTDHLLVPAGTGAGSAGPSFGVAPAGSGGPPLAVRTPPVPAAAPEAVTPDPAAPPAAGAPAPASRRHNPLALVPPAIALGIFALEALLYV